MNSIILNAATRILVALILLFSVFMLLRGHNEPGGGFIGGLVAAIGLTLYAIGHGTREARRALRADPRTIVMIGLAMTIIAAALSLLSGDEFFSGQWLFIGGGEGDKGLPISSVLLFDVGVYLAVIGAVLTLVFALEDEV